VDYQQVRAFCMEQPGAFEDFPFGPDSAVYKVWARSGRTAKMFALLWPERDGGSRINLKCDPVLAEQLRAAHPEITPGYHMSKKHWNTVDCSGTLDERTLRDLVEDSYDLVVASLPRADREALHWTGLAGGPAGADPSGTDPGPAERSPR